MFYRHRIDFRPLGGHVVIAIGLWIGNLGGSKAAAQDVHVLTYHNDNARTGWNPLETELTPTTVDAAHFGKVGKLEVNGDVYAQPLYVSGIETGGKTRDLVVVATEHGSVFAFDAVDYSMVWSTNLISGGTPVATGPTGDFRVPRSPDETGLKQPLLYFDIQPEVGITGTPVIKLIPGPPLRGVVFVVTKKKIVKPFSLSFSQELHALDLATGSERPGSPVTIAASVAGSGTGRDDDHVELGSSQSGGRVYFDPLMENQRTGLVLTPDGRTVYACWASHGDLMPYHGWVIGYDTESLAQVAVFNPSPNGGRSGIWMSGAAPACDAQGSIYFSTGNGTFEAPAPGPDARPARGDYGSSILKLTADPQSTKVDPKGNLNGWGLKVAGYFTPFNQALIGGEDRDIDLGSGGVVLIDQSNPSQNLLAMAGKQGVIYLINRDDMQKFRFNDKFDDVAQRIPANPVANPPVGDVFGIPAWAWSKLFITGSPVHAPTGAQVDGKPQPLRSFPMVGGKLDPAGESKTAVGIHWKFATPSLSGPDLARGIVWIAQGDSSKFPSARPSATLHAFAASDLGRELYNTEMSTAPDGSKPDRPKGTAIKFAVPTVAKGQVFLGSQGEVAVYGRLKKSTSTTANKVAPAPGLQQVRARFVAGEASAFASSPITEAVKALLAPENKSRLAESVRAARSLQGDLDVSSSAATVQSLQAVVTGTPSGTLKDDNPGFTAPPPVGPALGQDRVPLTINYVVSSINGVQVKHRSYNRAPVGPTIRVRPGQTLVIDLKNDLPDEPDPPGLNPPPPFKIEQPPHDLNRTNLHTHGLHVSPKEPADDIFAEVAPGGKRTYIYKIPDDHPAGTNWYHPHKHGSVGLQLANGMAGALIVEGGIDEYPEIKRVVAGEKVMVFQQMNYYQDPKAPEGTPATIPFQLTYSTYNQKPFGGPKPALTLINGEYQPVITMRPGEVQRWRLVHAGIQNTINLGIDGRTLQEIALDGIPLKEIRELQYAELQPGYRSDILVKASDQPGIYNVYNFVSAQGNAIKNTLIPGDLLAKVQVLDLAPATDPLPDPGQWTKWVTKLFEKMPGLADIDDVQIKNGTRRQIRFSHPRFGQFHIGGDVVNNPTQELPFDVDRVLPRIPLGATEEWSLTAMQQENHPFHIHINPFQVQVDYPDGKKRWVWKDTLLVTYPDPETIRSRFLDFSGKTVLHCHNLDHEDQGMMAALCIVDPKAPEADCPPAAPTNPGPGVGSPAPGWRLMDRNGREIASTALQGRRSLLIFHRGFDCWHCAEQVALLDRSATAFRELGIEILIVSPGDGPGRAAPLPVGPESLQVFVDPTWNAFRSYNCLAEGQILHGAFLVDGDGLIRWSRVGNQPETNIALILENARKFTGKPNGTAGPVAAK